jgi:hypothetical protein
MLEQLKNIGRRRGRALLAALATLVTAIAGCDKKVDWRGVSTDSRDEGRAGPTDAAPGESANGKRR